MLGSISKLSLLNTRKDFVTLTHQWQCINISSGWLCVKHCVGLFEVTEIEEGMGRIPESSLDGTPSLEPSLSQTVERYVFLYSAGIFYFWKSVAI